jgi:hypothetical protein
VASSADLTAVVEQALTDVLPDSMRPVQLDCIEVLDFDAAATLGAFDPHQFARNLRKAHLLHGKPWFPIGARVP